MERIESRLSQHEERFRVNGLVTEINVMTTNDWGFILKVQKVSVVLIKPGEAFPSLLKRKDETEGPGFQPHPGGLG